ncbi:hypothetical protein BDN71DRAFT_105404 [Pleurotus eryngii]|uniref:Endopeptidase S2P n=1 Tax=Pleurotus eryngii TaxID=5323 RepID=A0A9P5ZP90_PLEER|nr:hypothetical protein BDN71DRAFT_105404 [Pleurotus eryngii]
MRTRAFNKAHRRLRRRVGGSRVLRAVYTVGSVCGVAGMLFGYYVIYSSFFPSASPSPAKRSLSVHPIVPGVTTPLSHLPIIIVCLLLGQTIHELGHAVAAAVENIPLLHAGLSLSSAFVALPPFAPCCSLPAQLRIIAAGPFHNLVTFLLLATLPSLAPLLPSTDLSPHGALVLSVDALSVLRPYLPPGTIITHLDDYPLFHASHPDPWLTYLLAPQPAPLSPFDSPPDSLPHQGWCLPSPQFINAPSSCCDRSPNPHSPPDPSSHLACFDALHPLTHPSRCIDPIPILSHPPLPPYPNLPSSSQSPYKRCSSPRDCSDPQDPADTDGEAYACVRPRPAEHLLRITVLASLTSTSTQQENTMRLQTLLWTGPRREIYDQVHTTQRLPFPFPTSLFLHKPNAKGGKWGWVLSIYARLAPGARLLYTYTSLASLSLYTLNLLPLPHLDGAHFLSALLAMIGGDDEQGVGETLLPLYRAHAGMYQESTHTNTHGTSSSDDFSDDDDLPPPPPPPTPIPRPPTPTRRRTSRGISSRASPYPSPSAPQYPQVHHHAACTHEHDGPAARCASSCAPCAPSGVVSSPSPVPLTQYQIDLTAAHRPRGHPHPQPQPQPQTREPWRVRGVQRQTGQTGKIE